ncbi:MAG: transporter [Verrucomicrobia bacterium]|nr:transporter [Verrucomicrobiota bacterium]
MKFFDAGLSRTLFGLGLLAGALWESTPAVQAQGCVAIRGTGMCHFDQFAQPADADLTRGEWLASLGFRWFQSDRHFVGDVDQNRKERGNQVINNSYFWDLGVQYAINPRWSVALTIPFVYSTRSSLYEHPGAGRHETSAGGLGDIQLTPYVWLWDPAQRPKGNIQIGVGLSAPSGEYDATDTFFTVDGPVTGYVDQSIQPGTGGWGFTFNITAYRELLPRLTGFVNGTYLFNPEGINGTPTRTGSTRRNPYEQVMSIPDQYFGQGGFIYTVAPKWGLSLGVGARIDGVPAEDVFGSSDGFRRPGYAISVEPLVQWMKGRYTFSLATPIAVYRNRTQSVADQKWGAEQGRYIHGDAAFADFSVLANLAVSF